MLSSVVAVVEADDGIGDIVSGLSMVRIRVLSDAFHLEIQEEALNNGAGVTLTFAQDATLMAALLLDRLLHHAHIVPITGESYRLKHQRQTGIVQGIRADKAA